MLLAELQQEFALRDERRVLKSMSRGYVKGFVSVQSCLPGHLKVQVEERTVLLVAVDDTNTGQVVYSGATAELVIGDYKLMSKMPEGTFLPSVDEKADDRGRFPRISDTSCMICSFF